MSTLASKLLTFQLDPQVIRPLQRGENVSTGTVKLVLVMLVEAVTCFAVWIPSQKNTIEVAKIPKKRRKREKK